MTDFNTSLGLRSGDDGTIILETRPEHQVGVDFIHFAVLATVAEVAAAGSVQAPVVPSSIALSLMRPARPGILVGRGRLLKRGRRLAVAEGEVTQDDKLVAKAQVTFAVL